MTGQSVRGEFGRIDRFFKPLAAGFAGARGLADDAAVFGAPEGWELVVTTDAMVAGVHFLESDPPGDIAAKLLRVNLSDLAAMGAEPLAYTLVTALPKTVGEDWLAAFVAGLAEDQARFGIHLAGGDSVSTPGPILLSVTAFGLTPCGQALPRRSERIGDPVFVTGCIGGAALGLQTVLGTLITPEAESLVHRLRRPEPRVSIGPRLRGLALSCIDVSDGLVADLAHLAEESGAAAVLYADRVPIPALARGKPELLACALTGGDDYELLFTAPEEARDALAALARATGVPITEIGRIIEGRVGQVTVLDAAGAPLDLPRQGWDHFAA